MSHFKCNSNDVVSVFFSPSNPKVLIAVDSPLSFTVNVYNVLSGQVLACIKPYINALGARNTSFHNLFPYQISSIHPTTMRLLKGESSYEAGMLKPAAPIVEASKRVTNVELFSCFTVGSFDDKVRLISLSSFEAAFAFPLVHPSDMEISFITHINAVPETKADHDLDDFEDSSIFNMESKKSKAEENRLVQIPLNRIFLVESFENDEDNAKIKSR